MRFSVPQFIDVEDKLFGPLTLKQAVYLVGSLAGTYVAFRFLGVIGVVFVGIPLVASALLLGFVRVNNRPFSVVVASAFFYKMKNRLYLWKKTPQESQGGHKVESKQQPASVAVSPELTQSKLRALAFSLDTEEGYLTKDD